MRNRTIHTAKITKLITAGCIPLPSNCARARRCAGIYALKYADIVIIAHASGAVNRARAGGGKVYARTTEARSGVRALLSKKALPSSANRRRRTVVRRLLKGEEKGGQLRTLLRITLTLSYSLL